MHDESNLMVNFDRVSGYTRRGQLCCRTILSPFTKEYRALVSLRRINQFFRCFAPLTSTHHTTQKPLPTLHNPNPYRINPRARQDGFANRQEYANLASSQSFGQMQSSLGSHRLAATSFVETLISLTSSQKGSSRIYHESAEYQPRLRICTVCNM